MCAGVKCEGDGQAQRMLRFELVSLKGPCVGGVVPSAVGRG